MVRITPPSCASSSSRSAVRESKDSFRKRLPGGRRRHLRQEDVDDIGAILIPVQHLDEALRMARLCRVDQFAQGGLRGIGGKLAGGNV
jgi:hypothetical protein